MDLLTPEFGTIFWAVIGFSLVFIILTKFAWKPLLKGLKERDNSIAQALQAAEIAKRDVSQLHRESEKLLAQAKIERDKIVQEARELKESLLSESRELAKKEGHKMLEDARTAIKNERAAAIQDIKNQVAELSVSISEKILMHELADTEKQRELIDKSIVEAKLN
jgi:F-type H+-transporting ATPase subunit b